MKSLTDLLEENNLQIDVVNVDFEMAMVEAAMNSEESFEFDGDNYEVTVDRSDAESIWGTATEALTNAQRRKKAIQMKKGKASRMRKKKIAEKKLSSPEKIEGKSRKAARKVIEKKLLKGKDKSELSYSQRAALEKKVEKKKGAVSRIAKRLKKDVKKKDRERVKSRRSPKNEDVDVNEAKSLFEDSLVRGLANMSNGQSLSLEHGRLRITLKRVGKRVTFYTNLSGSPSSDDLRKKWDAAHPDFQYEELKSLSRKAMSTEYGAIKPATAYDGFTMTVKSMISKKNEDVNVNEALKASDIKKVLSAANKAGGTVKKNTIDFGEGSVIKVSIDDGRIKFDGGMSSDDEYFDNVKDAINAFEDVDFEKAKSLTKAEYDEVQNFSNFDKKDWKKQGSKYVRVKPVKEDTEFSEAFKVGQKVKVSRGPHISKVHEVIAKLDDGKYKVKPLGIKDKHIKYKRRTWDAWANDLKAVKEDTEFSEAFKVGQKVNVKRGPHTDVVHEVIAKLDGDKYNVKPVGLKPKDIKYPQGAAGAKGADLTLVNEDLSEEIYPELEGVTEAAGAKYVLMSDKDTKEYPKNRAGLKAAYQDAAKSKIWVITFKKANGDDEIVDSSDN